MEAAKDQFFSQQTNRSDQSKKFILIVALSLCLHLLLFVSLKYAQPFDDTEKKLRDKSVFIDLPQKTSPLVQQKEEEKNKGQVVESEQSADLDKPKDTKYLSDRNQKVAEETKARNTDIFRKGDASASAQKSEKAGKQLTFKDLAPARPITAPTPTEIEGYRVERQKQEAVPQSGGPVADARDSASNDYLKDIKAGDRTVLNTKEFVYMGYYRRIRQRLEVEWTTRLRGIFDNYMMGGRGLASEKEHLTGIVVTLDKTGKITNVQIMKNSGTRDLDQAAVDAFNRAGPFPDPPSGLVDEKGEIRITWDFIVQS